jgi:hypothetical protein
MLKIGVGFSVPVHRLLLLGSLVLLPALARADDFSFADAGTCTDPLFTGTFTSNSPVAATTTTPAKPGGGLCLAFGNHSGSTFTSLIFTAALPDFDRTNPDSSAFDTCFGGPFFATCDYVLDRRLGTITVEFFSGADANGVLHNGIPNVTDPAVDNFEINLNNPVRTCDAAGFCTTSQPFSNSAAGDWLVGGQGETITGVSNVPEPSMVPLLLVGFGALLTRARMLGNRNR